ncbi:protein phosphatase, partial [Streptomyces chumphonensis]
VGFAEEARPIVARLERLKGEAQSFVDSVKDDDEWTYDEEKIETNNALVGDISAAVAEFWAAERSAANKITALVNGTRWVANDGSDGANMYGLSVEDMRRAGETPWGRMAEEDHHWYEVGHWVKSYVWDG